jgi:hypothetical protein
VRLVGGGFEVIVVVDGGIAVEGVPKVFMKLIEKASRDEGGGSCVDAGFALAAAEADSDDTQLRGLGKEFGLDGGRGGHVV